MSESVAKLSICINENELVEGAVRVARAVRPSWTDASTKTTVFKDGITNKLVGVQADGNENDIILVRVYGKNTEWMINREVEIENIQALQRYSLAPRLYATFSNGLAYQYLPGKTLNVVNCKEKHVFPLVAEKMALFHRHLHVVPEGKSSTTILWDKIRSFIDLVPDQLSEPEKQNLFVVRIPSKEGLYAELQWLQDSLSALGSPLVLAHNDLLLGNILYDEAKHCVHFIDFEYTGLNYQAYDIANHFCEFAGVDDVDHSRYPSKEFQAEWLSVYLSHFSEATNSRDVELLLEQVDKFSPAPHFFWGVWALIQAAHSTIAFDFLGYAISRLDEYFCRKKQIFC